MYTTAAQAELRQHYLEGCKDVWLALDQVAIPCSFSFGRNVYQAWCPMGRVMHMCPPCLPNLPVPELHIQNGKDWLECEIHTVPSHSLLVWTALHFVWQCPYSSQTAPTRLPLTI